jgi:hypothetical protein
VPGSLRADLFLESPQQLKRSSERTRFELAHGGELAESVELGIGGAETEEAITFLSEIEGIAAGFGPQLERASVYGVEVSDEEQSSRIGGRVRAQEILLVRCPGTFLDHDAKSGLLVERTEDVHRRRGADLRHCVRGDQIAAER